MKPNSPAPLPPIVRPAATSAESSPPGKEDSPLRNRALVLALLFGVTGALGLPLLWYSSVFNHREKWFWSVVNVFYTALLIVIAVGAVWFALHSLSQP